MSQPPNKTACILPWISIETSPQGGARPCCLYREEITKENGERYLLTETPLSEIFNSKYMQDLRTAFRNGEKPEHCKSCWAEEEVGRQSKRMSSFVRLPHIVDDVVWEDNTSTQLKFIDLKLGNICNLKCRICGSWSSSKWAQEELDYAPDVAKKDHMAYTYLRQGFWPRNSPKFWEDLKSLLPEIVYFEFTGGEPFLIQEHFDLLKFAADNGHAEHIEIHYNTNSTVYPEDAFELWSKFKSVEVAFSIDDIGPRFEYQRYGANWEESVQNVQKINALRKVMPNLKTQVCLTVNVFNVYYLEELCNWVINQEFDVDYFNMLHDAWMMSIKSLTPEAKTLVIDKLTNGNFIPRHRRDVDQVIEFIKAGEGSDGTVFVKRIKQTDDYRNQKLSDHHPEIAEAMGYNK